MTDSTDNPLIVQGDHTVLLEVASPRFREARDCLLAFAELVKSPEHVHTYRITPLSIWNARAAGLEPKQIVDALKTFSRYPVPEHVAAEIRSQADRYGRLELRRGADGLELTADDVPLATEISARPDVSQLLQARLSFRSFLVAPADRGRLKRALIKAGFPVCDLAGYTPGETLSMQLRRETRAGEALDLRDYQRAAAESFYAVGSEREGNGVVVLPCGAGKTLVGMASMVALERSTLILTTSITAVRQWIDEILDKTTLQEDQVGEYTGARKEVRPVTVTTYQILTHRRGSGERMRHMELFDRRDWGLIVYDEVHLLPAPVFQITAGLQARRRLGLTATLVREDGLEDEVFALIGPKCIDVPWKELERDGWIAKAQCTEVRVRLPEEHRMPYALAPEREKFRIAAENPCKVEIVREILERHPEDQALVIGMYVEQVRRIGKDLGLPVMTGSTSQRRRDELYSAFREGRERVLVVSKIANFAVDLPDASLAIQISGTYGSRQEEAQRLGRILRPKRGANQAHFYTLVTRETKEQEFALRRQLFLCEQGYTYSIVDGDAR